MTSVYYLRSDFPPVTVLERLTGKVTTNDVQNKKDKLRSDSIEKVFFYSRNRYSYLFFQRLHKIDKCTNYKDENKNVPTLI